jgi:hypothetical protein
MGAIIGGISGLVLLLMTYLPMRASSSAKAIQEVRMEGILGEDQRKSSAPGMLYPGLGMEPLRRSDYEVIGMAKGNGCAHYVALWPLPIFWVRREDGGLNWFSFDTEGAASKVAWYKALESTPSADAMLSPRLRVMEKQSALFWYRYKCVALSGKGIEIKLDRTENR